MATFDTSETTSTTVTTLPTTPNVSTCKNLETQHVSYDLETQQLIDLYIERHGPVLYAERTIKENSAKNIKKLIKKKRTGPNSGVFHYLCAV